MRRQPFYAIRVVVTTPNGSTSTRDYVRGQHQHVGRAAFRSFAIGDMIALVSNSGDQITWAVYDIDFETVRQNRHYHHTTHTE